MTGCAEDDLLAWVTSIGLERIVRGDDFRDVH
jgi:hypothetical protein